MDASEFIHPDWLTGWQRIKQGFSGRKVEDEDILGHSDREMGEVLIYNGMSIYAPGHYWRGVGMEVIDRKGNEWTVTRRVDYHQDLGGYHGWTDCQRVYAVRVDKRKKALLSQLTPDAKWDELQRQVDLLRPLTMDQLLELAAEARDELPALKVEIDVRRKYGENA